MGQRCKHDSGGLLRSLGVPRKRIVVDGDGQMATVECVFMTVLMLWVGRSGVGTGGVARVVWVSLACAWMVGGDRGRRWGGPGSGACTIAAGLCPATLGVGRNRLSVGGIAQPIGRPSVPAESRTRMRMRFEVIRTAGEKMDDHRLDKIKQIDQAAILSQLISSSQFRVLLKINTLKTTQNRYCKTLYVFTTVI